MQILNPPSVLDPTIWGPHYWVFLHTMSFGYPDHPSSVIKKKYYDFIHNIPYFLPNEKIAKDFTDLLSLYPLSPYLDSRVHFIEWMHFIHNKINEKSGKPPMTLYDMYLTYYDLYKPKLQTIYETTQWKKKIMYSVIIFLLFIFIYMNL